MTELWTFQHEKDYVDNLGTYRGRRVSTEEYIKLLKQYLQILELRADNPNWLEQIKKYVTQRIKVEEQCLEEHHQK